MFEHQPDLISNKNYCFNQYLCSDDRFGGGDSRTIECTWCLEYFNRSPLRNLFIYTGIQAIKQAGIEKTKDEKLNVGTEERYRQVKHSRKSTLGLFLQTSAGTEYYILELGEHQ